MKGSNVTVMKRVRLGLASYLGSTGRTLLVRCPCGRRNYFDRRAWAWFEVAFCVRCWQAIRYHDLRVVSRWEGERMLREDLVFEGELKALRTLEARMRRFVTQFNEGPLWKWPLEVRGMAHGVESDLRLAERSRARQGAEEPATPTDGMTAQPSTIMELPDAEGYALTEQERRLIQVFSTLPEEQRARVLGYVEVTGTLYGEVIDEGAEGLGL